MHFLEKSKPDDLEKKYEELQLKNEELMLLKTELMAKIKNLEDKLQHGGGIPTESALSPQNLANIQKVSLTLKSILFLYAI